MGKPCKSSLFYRQGNGGTGRLSDFSNVTQIARDRARIQVCLNPKPLLGTFPLPCPLPVPPALWPWGAMFLLWHGVRAGSLGGLLLRTTIRHMLSARGNKHPLEVTSHGRGMTHSPSSSPTEHLLSQASCQQEEQPMPGATAPSPSPSPGLLAGRKQVWGKERIMPTGHCEA